MSENNPLQKYFRATKLFIPLPSGTSYYDANVVEFNESGEVGVMPMTAKDEVLTKNPDALLNGEALIEIIQSCVPAVKNPRKLLSNDMDALMIAVRHATYGESIDVNLGCPSCGTPNTFAVDLSNCLASMTFLEKEYTVDQANGIVLYVKPFSYEDTVKGLRLQFEEFKATRSITADNIEDEKRLEMFSDSYTKIALTNIELLAGSIYKVTMPGEDGETIEVTDRKHIDEFLKNTDKTTFHSVDNLVKDINDVGVMQEFTAKCTKCEHEWEASIEFNPVNFFTDS